MSDRFPLPHKGIDISKAKFRDNTPSVQTADTPKHFNVWSSIHRYVVDHYNDWNATEARQYYHRWLTQIPVHKPDGATCGCQSNWATLTTLQPPDFSTAPNFERWLFDRHDDVSREHALARRLTFDQSRQLWHGPRVGILATTYQAIGGTETFHRTLLPELRHYVDIVGFHATSCAGDTSLLRVPYFRDRKQLVDQCDVIITWGITGLSDCAAKKVISMHHADCGSPWSDQLQLQNEIDQIVCVNPNVPLHLSRLTSTPATYLPNPLAMPVCQGIDVRSRFKFEGRGFVLWPHRWSAEKQPTLAIEIAKHLPEHLVMVVTEEYREKQDKVFFIGKHQNIADWIKAAHCVLSLSTFEGFGYSVAEAMMLGVPVVSYEKGICNDQNASIIPPDSTPDRIADLCTFAVKSPRTPNFDEHDPQRVAQLWADMIRGL
jgi:glycosyltransferase involved in cell wall biosynthesis